MITEEMIEKEKNVILLEERIFGRPLLVGTGERDRVWKMIFDIVYWDKKRWYEFWK